MAKLSIGLVCIVTATLFSSCEQRRDSEVDRDPFGNEFNAKRQELGVPIIENDWVNFEKYDSNYFWMDKSGTVVGKEAHHSSKAIELKADLIVETDGFSYLIGEEESYRLSIVNYISYDFNVERRTFELTVYYDTGYPPTKSFEYDNNAADSLMKAWGIEKDTIYIKK